MSLVLCKCLFYEKHQLRNMDSQHRQETITRLTCLAMVMLCARRMLSRLGNGLIGLCVADPHLISTFSVSQRNSSLIFYKISLTALLRYSSRCWPECTSQYILSTVSFSTLETRMRHHGT